MNFNLLDLNNDVLNIIGYYVKKDNLERKIKKDMQLRSYRQIINGKEIRFCLYFDWYYFRSIYGIKEGGITSRDLIKKYLFNQIDNDIKYIKVHARVDKIKLTKPDIRMCIWIWFQRYKFILNDKLNLNVEDENNYFDEYLTLKKLNLKKKNYSFNY